MDSATLMASSAYHCHMLCCYAFAQLKDAGGVQSQLGQLQGWAAAVCNALQVEQMEDAVAACKTLRRLSAYPGTAPSAAATVTAAAAAAAAADADAHANSNAEAYVAAPEPTPAFAVTSAAEGVGADVAVDVAGSNEQSVTEAGASHIPPPPGF
jgi:hypothetical protein